MRLPEAVVIVGESIAGITAARELRNRGFTGALTIVGDDDHGAYARPPLSKLVLHDTEAEAGLAYATDDLGIEVVRSPATSLDVASQKVITANGTVLSYDALIVATGSYARRLAAPDQAGELVVRTLADAGMLRTRLAEAKTAIVVGAGFLGMEVASACLKQGLLVAVLDVEAPLRRLLGEFLSETIARRAADLGVVFVEVDGPVTLTGSPVSGVCLPDGTTMNADVVVTCAGDVPAAGWLAGTDLDTAAGVPIDSACATSIPGVFAVGDVTCLARSDGATARAPFWSNAVAQAKVAAASILGLEPPCAALDDYFWTEILGISIKVVGPLPLSGEPEVLAGSIADGDALLRWKHNEGTTVVAYGRRIGVGRLKALAATPL